MRAITITRTINAPVEKVFATIAACENYAEAVPDITHVEVLSDLRQGLGARFRETRVMKGKEVSSTMEVVAFEENKSIRFSSDQAGAVWDSAFTLTPLDGGTEISLTMEAKPYKLMAKIVTPLIKGMVRKAVAKDMDAVKAYCEV